MGFANNVVPSFIVNDPEKMDAFMTAMRDLGDQPVLSGMEDWVPEDETEDARVMDELGTGNLSSTIYRIVNARGEVERSSASTAFNKPYYATLKGAKSALTYLRRRATGSFRLQKGEVTWEEL